MTDSQSNLVSPAGWSGYFYSPGFDRAFSKNLFCISIILHILVISLLTIIGQGSIYEFSRDSFDYHVKSMVIAEQYHSGNIQWSRWLDDGWFQFIGIVYALFGPFLIIILLINSIFTAFATILCYRIAAIVFQDEAIGRLSAVLLVWFPSVVYYTSLPLKEGAALFAILSIVYGIVRFQAGMKKNARLWMFCGLAILSALRIYLSIVSFVCVLICIIPRRTVGGIRGMFRIGFIGLSLVLFAVLGIYLLDIDISKHDSLRYFDLDYINHVRHDMNSGNARMFRNKSDAQFGDDIFGNIKNLAIGLFFFIFSIDVTQIKRERQLAAIPEMLFFFYCLPYLFRGAWHGWKTIPRQTLPILLFGLMVVAIYSSGTTNMGAMYRWRVQALPFLIMIIIYGASIRQTGILYTLLCRVRKRVAAQFAALYPGPVPGGSPAQSVVNSGDLT